MHTDSWSVYLHGNSYVSTEKGSKPIRALSRNDIIICNGNRIIVSGNNQVAKNPGIKSMAVVELTKNSVDENCPDETISIPSESILELKGVKLKAGQIVNSATISQKFVDCINVYKVDLVGVRDLSIGGIKIYLHGFNKELFEKNNIDILKIRQNNVRRALHDGWSYIEDKSIQVAIEDAIISPSAGDNIYELNHPQKIFRIFSRSGIVTEQHPESEDVRRLGVAISGVRADEKYIAIDSKCFRSGFYDIEHSEDGPFRWSDGNSVLEMPFYIRKLQLIVKSGLPILEKN